MGLISEVLVPLATRWGDFGASVSLGVLVCKVPIFGGVSAWIK